MTDGFGHEPVMVAEIVDLFAVVPAGTVLDATVGGGGHAEALLERHGHLRVLGLDRDPMALAAARQRLERFGDRVTLVHARFDGLAEVLRRDDVRVHLGGGLAGALFDLGVSSPQLDRAERGFSYRFDAPLDMRMDTTQTRSAADVLNTASEQQLERILRDFGDEPNARRIAKAIVARRPLERTGQLVALLEDVIPAPARRRGGHPAKRTFQAIRIEVNDELAVLSPAIDDAIGALAAGGRIAVLAYHSGEDRIVKARLRQAETGGCTCPPQLGCRCGATRLVSLVWRGSKRPSAAETAANPRAESARLRAATKLEVS
ncbi:MAG: 16S rRNA (cytosine(1402)-N(4))-methyltransferase RsmH [Acidimicrobiales bacterium]|nr:16S rRNA (cytosine(1402)-N(4))-methyltransferase RsmH [Acidimicrobiales bacterium]